MKLLLLSGAIRREGWRTLDADPAHHADYVRSIPPLNMPPESCEEIELCHGISHFFQWEAAQLLREAHAALISGGRLILEQPNLLFAAEVLTGARPRIPGTVEGQCDMWPIYGDPTRQETLYGHKWGWSPETLTRALVEAGFAARNIWQTAALTHVPGRDFRIEAVK